MLTNLVGLYSICLFIFFGTNILVLMSDTENISVKVCIMGEPAVGKTTLRKNYIGKGMEGDFLMTLGADLSESTIPISDKITLDVQIWDIAGQDNFAPIIGEYLQGSQGAILVYDMTRGYTFDAVTKWLDRLHEANPKMEGNIPFIVVGNKADLENFYDYDESKVNEFIDYVNRHQLYTKTNVEHIQTSAKTGYAVQEAFKRLGKIIIRNWIDQGEEIEGASDLFDDMEEVETKPEVTKPKSEQNIAASTEDDEERLVRPSELLKRRETIFQNEENNENKTSTTNYTPSQPTATPPNQDSDVSTDTISFSEVSYNEETKTESIEKPEPKQEPKEELKASFSDFSAYQFGEDDEEKTLNEEVLVSEETEDKLETNSDLEDSDKKNAQTKKEEEENDRNNHDYYSSNY